MTTTRGASLARNVLSNWVVVGANVAYALFITPIIVRALDAELYGVWSFLSGLLAYSELLYLGLGSALIKYVAQLRTSSDLPGINRLASVVATIYSGLGLLCFGVLALASSFVPAAFAEPLSSPAAHAATLTCILLGARLMTVFVGSAFAGVVTGYERFDAVNAVYVASILVRFVATPLVLSLSDSPLIALAALTLALGVLEVGGMMGVAFWLVPRLRVRPVRPRAAELRWLYGFGVQSFFILLAVKLISYTDTTVIGVMLGATSVAMYVLPLQLVEYIRLTVGGFAGVFLPRVTVLSTVGDASGLREAYLRSARFGCFLAGWLGGLLVSLGPAFLSQWVGPEYGAPATWVMGYLTVATFGQVLSSQVPLAFYQGLHLLRFPAAILMAEALTNLALSLVLAPRLGITGVALATAIPALASASILPPYLCRRLGIPFTHLVRQAIGPGALLFAATAGLQFALGAGAGAESYLALAGRSLLTVPVAIGMIAVAFPPDDRQTLWRLAHLTRARNADSGTRSA